MNRGPKMESSAAPVIERHDSMIPNDSKSIVYSLVHGRGRPTLDVLAENCA